MENDVGKICAIVVTHNRKELLIKCLEALSSQGTVLAGIYVVDNDSTDGTAEALKGKGYISDVPGAEQGPVEVKSPVNMSFGGEGGSQATVHYVRMPENAGGAGGFREGMERAFAEGYDWLWLMDDDVIVRPDTLGELLTAREILRREGKKPGFLSSKVVNRKDMIDNAPSIQWYGRENTMTQWAELLEHGLAGVENCSFASFLVQRDIVADVGYPLKELFIWSDDVEYTLRISAKYPCYMAGRSIVRHERNIAGTLSILREEDPGRIRLYYYYYRNRLWVLRKYSPYRFVLNEQLSLVIDIFRILFGDYRHKALRAGTLIRSLFAGTFSRGLTPLLDGKDKA